MSTEIDQLLSWLSGVCVNMGYKLEVTHNQPYDAIELRLTSDRFKVSYANSISNQSLAYSTQPEEIIKNVVKTLIWNINSAVFDELLKSYEKEDIKSKSYVFQEGGPVEPSLYKVEAFGQYYQAAPESISNKLMYDFKYNSSGKQDTKTPMAKLRKSFDLLQVIKCAECSDEGTIWKLVQHMNDVHKMTRNEIADYLETLDIDTKMKEKQND